MSSVISGMYDLCFYVFFFIPRWLNSWGVLCVPCSMFCVDLTGSGRLRGPPAPGVWCERDEPGAEWPAYPGLPAAAVHLREPAAAHYRSDNTSLSLSFFPLSSFVSLFLSISIISSLFSFLFLFLSLPLSLSLTANPSHLSRCFSCSHLYAIFTVV